MSWTQHLSYGLNQTCSGWHKNWLGGVLFMQTFLCLLCSMYVKNQQHVTLTCWLPLLADPGHHDAFITPCIVLEGDVHSYIVQKLSKPVMNILLTSFTASWLDTIMVLPVHTSISLKDILFTFPLELLDIFPLIDCRPLAGVCWSSQADSALRFEPINPNNQ